MEIIPAIDLRGGRCVRLFQGDYRKETVFSDDPLDTALKWQSMGASRLHIVDLDGAAEGEPRNLNIVEAIASAALIPLQLGGGIRTLDTIRAILKAGVDRVILGTVAIEDPALVREATRQFEDSIIVGIDALDGYVAVRGWQKTTEIKAEDLLKSMVKLGVRRFIYTDISRDGTLSEPNFTAISEIINAVHLPIIAAGGVSSLSHIRILKQLGAEGVIIGKALYTGDINLKQALELNE